MVFSIHHMQHHAHLLVGTHDACFALVPAEHRTGVDAEIIIEEQLSVDAARALRAKASQRPILSDKRRFVISCARFTREAQNALLKLFEDPPVTAEFYLIAPRASALLPTLRSRLEMVLVPSDEKVVDTRVAPFLAASYAERLAEIAGMQKAKDTEGMRTLIAGIERVLAADVSNASVDTRVHLVDVALASMYAEVKGGSPKMLLEHLALSLPERL